jgi:hypothetical protein
MSEELSTHSCDEYPDNLAELALGILTGRDRAATLAHVETCAACGDELEQLSRAADALVLVAPEIEPPVGFEVSLFSRMGVDEVSARRRARPSRWVLASAAAVVALVVGLSIGWAVGTSHGKSPTTTALNKPAGTPITTADLLENGKPVGHVFTYGGSRPWMSMTLADSSARGKVTCKVVTEEGTTRTVGTFVAKAGYGAWGAPLPVTPQTVRMAEVVASNGAVIATATLS